MKKRGVNKYSEALLQELVEREQRVGYKYRRGVTYEKFD
jgi:hypothetical protein